METQEISLIDRLSEYQQIYNIISYQIECELEKTRRQMNENTQSTLPTITQYLISPFTIEASNNITGGLMTQINDSSNTSYISSNFTITEEMLNSLIIPSVHVAREYTMMMGQNSFESFSGYMRNIERSFIYNEDKIKIKELSDNQLENAPELIKELYMRQLANNQVSIVEYTEAKEQYPNYFDIVL